jgi:RimJ/RimL family protein N-acetyltransferase
LPFPEKIEGKKAVIIPLSVTHIDELWETAQDESLWRYYAFQKMNNLERFKQFIINSIETAGKGNEYTFTLIDKSSGKMIGGASFLDISPENRSLEIGRTWIAPYLQGSGFNTEVKHLLLKYCFEELHLGRVFFKTDSTNTRSRQALEKIGAKYEGTLRNHMLREDDSYRHSAYYSIIDSEWETVKRSLEKLLDSGN